MKISVAQIKPIKGNISENILTHQKLIDFAISHQADAIFFPELSLTGYEPELAKYLAKNPRDKIFNSFQTISNQNNITIGIGVPTKANSGIQISMLIFQPKQSRQVYSKQQLHADEFPYFVCGNKQSIITIKHKKIAPAICYESLQPNHADNANQMGADIYIASVAKSQSGINKAMNHYPEIAKKYPMPVLMANCIGFCDNFESVGYSSVWSKQGDLVGQLNDKQEGILTFDTTTEEVSKRII